MRACRLTHQCDHFDCFEKIASRENSLILETYIIIAIINIDNYGEEVAIVTMLMLFDLLAKSAFSYSYS